MSSSGAEPRSATLVHLRLDGVSFSTPVLTRGICQGPALAVRVDGGGAGHGFFGPRWSPQGKFLSRPVGTPGDRPRLQFSGRMGGDPASVPHPSETTICTSATRAATTRLRRARVEAVTCRGGVVFEGWGAGRLRSGRFHRIRGPSSRLVPS